MYENFAFETRGKAVVGYHFPCENPKKVMCVIHGIGEHMGRYRRMADKLNHQGIAVVGMDLRGHGISSGVRGDTAPRMEILKDIDAMLDYASEFYPDVPIILYGHSMGGNLCLDYRARGLKNEKPEKYIVSAPWVKLVSDFPNPVVALLKGLAKVMPKMTISQKIAEEELGNPEYVRPYLDDPLVHNKVSLQCAAQCFTIGNDIYDGTHEDSHRADEKPFLLMHGDADSICAVEGARKVAERMAGNENFTYVELQGYYHEIHNGGPDATGDEVIDRIAEFILK